MPSLPLKKETYLLKETALSFIEHFYSFSSLSFIYFCSDFCYFCPSTDFRLCLFFFFQFFQILCQIVYLGFFSFLEVGLYCYKFHSQYYFCCIPYVFICCFSFSFVSRYILNSPLTYSLIQQLFSSMWFTVQIFVTFPTVSCS